MLWIMVGSPLGELVTPLDGFEVSARVGSRLGDWGVWEVAMEAPILEDEL